MSTWLVKYTRKGKCDFRKCGTACCSALNIKDGEIENDFNSNVRVLFTDHRCDNISLLPDARCSVYYDRPFVCREFPVSPWDLIYMRIKNRCTYWFEIEIKEVEENVSPSPDLDIDAGG